MSSQTVTLELPEPLYEQLQARAARRQRTVADEVLDVLTGASPATEALPDDLEQAIAQLVFLEDGALWQAGRSKMASDDVERLSELNAKRQREGITEAEQQESELLVRQYERSMLVRAQAAALLKQRGHDVSSLLAAP
jgi:plasmid stability protein